MAEIKTNAEVIHEADGIQQNTKVALYRIQQQAAQIEELGDNTLSKMKHQHYQSKKIQEDAENLNSSLKKTKKLQNSFDRLTGNWRGRHKKQAQIEAKEYIAAADKNHELDRVGRQNSDTEKYKYAVSSHTKVVKKLPDQAKLTSSVVATSRREDQNLDAEEKMGLDRLASNENDIDAMLDQMAPSLDRLVEMSMSMGEETQAQCANMDKLTKAVKKGNTKQAIANSRIKRNLTGRWIKRTHAD
jgi:hypothetical protein